MTTMKAISNPMNSNHTRLRLSKDDHLRLVDMLDSDLVVAILPEDDHKEWSARLRESQIVDLNEVEPLVSMNDMVQLLDVDSGVRETFQLVFPEEADIRRGRLSVLAPVGTLLLGCRVGDGIIWNTPDRVRRLCVEKIVDRRPKCIECGAER